MGMDPRLLLVASITPLHGDVDTTLQIIDPDEVRELQDGMDYYTIVTSSEEMGGTIVDNSFSLYTTIIYGWGDILSLEDFSLQKEKFRNKIYKFCEQLNCTAEFHLQVWYD